jgi:hypothetical protein
MIDDILINVINLTDDLETLHSLYLSNKFLNNLIESSWNNKFNELTEFHQFINANNFSKYQILFKYDRITFVTLRK